MRKLLFAPDGWPISDVLVHSITSGYVELDDDGRVSGHELREFADYDFLETDAGDRIVSTHGSAEFLERHCRIVEVYEEFDEYTDDEESRIEPWPDDIVPACQRLVRIGEGLKLLRDMRLRLPDDFRDTTTNVVLDAIVKGRLEDEIATLNARIDAFRAGRTEVTKIEEPDEETTVSEDA